jgi:hypothetical protein
MNLIISSIRRKIVPEPRRKIMIKNYTIKPNRKVGGTGRTATQAGAVGLGAVLIVLGGLVMLGNSILDVFKKSKA